MSADYKQILPEDPVPHSITEEQRLKLSEHSTARLIWGEGNPRAPVFVVLDNPGARETKSGEAFLCGTRQTLQKGALQAGLNLSQIYVSYLLRARPLKKYDKEKARGASLPYLVGQIKRHKPAVVFCLGTVVVQAYFNDPEASVKSLRGKIYNVNGFPTVVSYHPLGVRRRPVLYKYFAADWALAAAQLRIQVHGTAENLSGRAGH